MGKRRDVPAKMKENPVLDKAVSRTVALLTFGLILVVAMPASGWQTIQTMPASRPTNYAP